MIRECGPPLIKNSRHSFTMPGSRTHAGRVIIAWLTSRTCPETVSLRFLLYDVLRTSEFFVSNAEVARFGAVCFQHSKRSVWRLREAPNLASFTLKCWNWALSSERPARISQAHDKLRRSKLPRYLAGTLRCLLNSEAVPTRKPPLPLTHEHVQLSAPENKRKPGPAKTWHCHTPKLCTLITL